MTKKRCKTSRFFKEVLTIAACFLFSLFFFGYLGATVLNEILKNNPFALFWAWTIIGFFATTAVFYIHSANKKALREALKNSNIDARTGLHNDRFIPDAISIVFSNAMRISQGKDSCYFCCALLDVDDFKNINDSHGYNAGNAALRIVAKKLKKSVRGDDIAIRYAGDEFLVIFAATNPALLIKKLYLAFKEPAVFYAQNEEEVLITVSIGWGRMPISKQHRQNEFELYEKVFAQANVILKKRKKKKGIKR